MEERLFHVMLGEVCEEKGIKMEKLSYNWILQLTKDGKVRHITGCRFDINPEASGDIASDKYATFEVLNSQNIPMIKHTMIFNPASRGAYVDNDGTWLKITSEFLKNGKLVVKPNNGCEGQGVYLCKTLKEVEVAVQKLFKSNASISICPYYDIITEYRTFYLDGKVFLIYGKTKPFVIGDGRKTLGELIEELNLPDKNVVRENISSLDLLYVPEKDEKVEISWKHNLSGGATPKILEKGELYDRIEQLSIAAGKAINMNFATIDIIETTDNNLYVLEVNSGIGATIFTETVEGARDIMKNIYRYALDLLFK